MLLYTNIMIIARCLATVIICSQTPVRNHSSLDENPLLSQRVICIQLKTFLFLACVESEQLNPEETRPIMYQQLQD
jgi:hypothetical protein